MAWMKNEKQTILDINRIFGLKLTRVKNRFSDYDAEDDNYLVEIKNRRKYYKTKMIEEYKLNKNLKKAKSLNKEFIYVVTDDYGMYIYNMSKLDLPELQEFDCPRNTDFGGKESRKIKKIYNLKESDAVKIVRVFSGKNN